MWTQSSSPVQRPDMYKPLSDEVILAQQKSVYDRADQEAKKIGSTYNSLFGISTYGKDAEVLAQMQEQFKQQVGELSKQGLANPEVNSRINQLITQYSSSPDVLAIHQRISKFNKDTQEFQDLQKSGKPLSEWRQKSLKQANEYYSGDKYYKDTRFTGQVKVDPEINKIKLETLKSLKEEPYQTKDKNGFIVMKYGISPERVREALGSMVENDGMIKDYMNDKFDAEYEDVVWDDEADNTFNSLYEAYSVGAMSPNPETASSAQANLDALDRAKGSSMYVDLMKQKSKENWLNSQWDADADAYGVINKIESKAADAQLHAINAQVDFQNAKNLELYKQQAGLYEYMDAASQAAFENKDFVNVDMQTAAVNKHNFELAKKQADAALLNPKVDDKNIIPGTNTSYGQLKRGLLTDDKENTSEIIPADNASRLADMVVNNQEISKEILKKYGLTPEQIDKAISTLSDPKASKDEYGTDGYTTDVEGIAIKPKGYLKTEEMDFIIPKAALSDILLKLNPTGKYQEPNQGTGTNTTNPQTFTKEELLNSGQGWTDSLINEAVKKGTLKLK